VYLNSLNRLGNGLVIVQVSILKRTPRRILKLCSPDVRQAVSVPLAGCGKGALHGELGIPLISSIGSVPRERPALPGRQFGFLKLSHAAVSASVQGKDARKVEAVGQFANQLCHVVGLEQLGRAIAAHFYDQRDASAGNMRKHRFGLGVEFHHAARSRFLKRMPHHGASLNGARF
jgi:hypothetical protein